MEVRRVNGKVNDGEKSRTYLFSVLDFLFPDVWQRLRACFPLVVKKAAQQVDLHAGHHHHHHHVGAGPDVDTVIVAFLQVTITRLEGLQHRLNLQTLP